MKSVKYLVMAIFSTYTGDLVGQGIFQNLNFESARIQQTQAAGFVSSTNAFPAWSFYLGTSQQTRVGFNNPSLGSTFACLLGTNYSGIASVIDGGFSALLQGGGIAPYATLNQTGLVPPGSRSIFFKAQPGSGTLAVSLGGQNIPFMYQSTGSNFILYGGDVSLFAGQTLELAFTAFGSVSQLNNWNIDDIVFSTQSIPEPSSLALFSIGALFLGIFHRRNSSQ